VSINDNTFPIPDGSQQEETVGEAFADYLGLVEETIRTHVTDRDIKARIRYAVDQAVSSQDSGLYRPQIQRDVRGQDGGNDQPNPAEDHIPGEGPKARPRRLKGRAGDHHSRGFSELSNRRALLDTLVALMHDPRQGPAVLAGPGGTGKTTVAAALAGHAQAAGDPVWWISAADPVTLSQGLTAVAQQLGGAWDVEAINRGAADAADRFWRLLENACPRWLLVFDEADDPQVLAAGGSPAGVQDLTGWVRSSARGLALVTSRETDRRMWGAAQLVTIDELREADAAQVLLELAPSAGDEDQARALARRLGRHPLSLRLAGGYLRSQAAEGATFAAYRLALGEQAEGGPYARGRHAAVPAEVLTARAVQLSLDGLAQQGLPQTRPVLELASCYAPTTIPAGLLGAGSALLTSPDDTSPTAPGRAEEALRKLADVGILEPTEGGFALHAAIIEAGRASLDGSDPSSARIRHAAIELLAASAAKLPVDQPEAWPQYLLLGSHLLSVLETAAGRVDREHLILLMETTARTTSAFQHSGASQAGNVLCERALTHGAALGNEHRAVLRVRHEMAWAVADRGDLDEAEALFRDVFQTRRRVLGAGDEDVLDSRHELAWIAACRQDWVAAEKGYRETLADSIRIRDPEDPRIMLTRHELAWVIARQGRNRLDEAREIFRTVLADRRRVLGADHPRTLTTLHELAWIAARQGKWIKAETAYRKLLVLRLRILGEDHPDTILTRHELAWIAARRGRIPEAEARYSNVLNQRRRILGEDHPQTLATQKALEELRRGQIIDADHLA
jgi:tetratricopeptide (TPR) repeat protein